MRVYAASVGIVLFGMLTEAHAAPNCANLASLRLADTTITKVEDAPDGNFSVPGPVPAAPALQVMLPAHCGHGIVSITSICCNTELTSFERPNAAGSVTSRSD